MRSWLHRELNERENVLQPKAEYFHLSFAWLKKMGHAILIESELKPFILVWTTPVLDLESILESEFVSSSLPPRAVEDQSRF